MIFKSILRKIFYRYKKKKFNTKAKFINTSHFIKSDYFGFLSAKHKKFKYKHLSKDLFDMNIESFA